MKLFRIGTGLAEGDRIGSCDTLLPITASINGRNFLFVSKPRHSFLCLATTASLLSECPSRILPSFSGGPIPRGWTRAYTQTRLSSVCLQASVLGSCAQLGALALTADPMVGLRAASQGLGKWEYAGLRVPVYFVYFSCFHSYHRVSPS